MSSFNASLIKPYSPKYTKYESLTCMNKVLTSLLTATLLVVTLLQLVSCSNKVPTADDAKYLPEFHDTYFGGVSDMLSSNELTLYVDYSTCIALGQEAPFFQALVPSWTNATKRFFAIKGSSIEEHSADSTFLLLRNVSEVNYADIKTAAERITAGSTEAVLLTDGEYFQPSEAKGNINNPYLAEAFKTWLKKGHDIYIFAEPYEELYKGDTYQKKRFYFIFTDSRLTGNIYERIIQTVDLKQFPNVSLFHLSADHPTLYTADGRATTPHSTLNAKVTPGANGYYEIQDWEIDWKSGIEPLLVNATDPETGEPLPSGEPFTSGLKVDKGSFGGYRITGVSAKVYNINQEYTDFYTNKESKVAPAKQITPAECDNFVEIDNKAWQKKDGVINLHFNTEYYDPASVLNGSPFNYFKIDLCVAEVQPDVEQYQNKLSFDSIDMPGNQNVSVVSSIQQSLADPDIMNKMNSCVIYTIYVKANQR